MAGKQSAKKSSGVGPNSIKAAILLRLAKGAVDRNDLMSELKETHDPKALAQTLNGLIKSGQVMAVGERKKKCSLRKDFPTFKIAFSSCAAEGSEREFLATAYSKTILSSEVFPVLTRDLVRSAVLSTLLLLTMPPVERSEKPSLFLLYRAVYKDPITSTAMQGIGGALEAVGFPELLKKGLAGAKTKPERESVRFSMLENLADECLSRFLGEQTQLPSALEVYQSLLFPKKERAEMLDIMRHSPFALSFILANEDRSRGTVMSIVTPLLLPALEHMFTLCALFRLFSSSDVDSYIENKKKRADLEFKEVVERRKAGMQQPSQLLLALRSCRLAEGT